MIGAVLPLALVVGLSPLPILPAVLLLMTPRARANGVAYLIAWLLGLTSVVLAALWLGSLADPDPATEQSVGWLQVGTGAVFLVMAGVKWLTRPRAGKPKESPGWLAALGAATPRSSARLGALLAMLNPKNLAMALAAGAEVAYLAQGPSQAAVGVIGFVLVGSIGVATPILGSLVLGERAAPLLERARSWLERHSTALSIGVLVVLGVLMIVQGLP
ncbi:MAG TPA: GAP family protein [Candidatus Nanopelagicales bacterium]